MKTFLLFVFITMGIQAQTIHELDWDISVGTSLNLTIEVGEIVRWTWTDNFPHSVVSKSGSTQTFSSDVFTGIGNSFQFIFTEVGSNPYICGVHTSTMGGTITVQEALSNEEFSIKTISLSPNPAKDHLTLSIPSGMDVETISIYNVIGKEVINTSYLGNYINISNLNPGMYFLKISTPDASQIKRFVKQ